MSSIQFWTLSPHVLLAASLVRGQHRGQQLRQVQHRAGEDDGDDARLVDLQRDVGALAAVLLAADHPFGELNGDPSLALFDEDDHHQQDDEQQDDPDETAPRPASVAHQGTLVGERGSRRTRR